MQLKVNIIGEVVEVLGGLGDPARPLELVVRREMGNGGHRDFNVLVAAGAFDGEQLAAGDDVSIDTAVEVAAPRMVNGVLEIGTQMIARSLARL